MAPFYAEPRLPPLVESFVECKWLVFAPRDGAEARALERTWALRRYVPSMLRRRHSIGSYVPHKLAVLESPQGPRRGGRGQGAAAPAASVADADVDAAAPPDEEEWPCTDDESPAVGLGGGLACAPASRARGCGCRSTPVPPELGCAPPEPSAAADSRLGLRGGLGDSRAAILEGCAFVSFSSSPATAALVGPWPGSPHPTDADAESTEGSICEPGSASHAPSTSAPALLTSLAASPARSDAAEEVSGAPVECPAPRASKLGPGVTTVMVRNLRKDLQRAALQRELDSAGFLDQYDFLYLPVDFVSRENKGYAFVNFTAEEAAEAFATLYQRSHPKGITHHKGPALNVSAAAVQGLEANVLKWVGPAKSRIRNPAFGPFVCRRLATGRGSSGAPAASVGAGGLATSAAAEGKGVAPHLAKARPQGSARF